MKTLPMDKFVRRIVSTAALAAAGFSMSPAAGVTVTTNGTDVTVVNTIDESLDLAFHAPEVETVTYDPGHILTLTSPMPSTYAGGTTIRGNYGNAALVQINGCDGVFGTGDVTLVGPAGLYARSSAVAVTNRINVTATSLVGSFDSVARLTLFNVGFSDETYDLRIGRANQTPTYMALSLTEESDAMWGISCKGALGLTLDGGLIKMSESAHTPFFNLEYPSLSSLTVSTNGTAFSVPGGIRASLGLPLATETVRSATVWETRYPQSHDFESGTTGWGCVLGTGTELGLRRSNGSPFDGEGYGTPDGTYYMMLRCGNVLTQVVENVSAGLWRLRFLCGCRKGTDGPYSPQPVDVTIGGTTVLQIRESARFPFTEYETEAVELPDGATTVIGFTVGGTYGVGSMNIDRVVMERVTYSYLKAPVVKSGAGDLTFAGERFAHAALAVSGGTLALAGCELEDVTATARAGGRLALGDNTCGDDVRFAVEAGGTLALSEAGTNLVRHASFEADTSGWGIGVPPIGWTSVSGICGVQRDGGTITPTGPFTPFGKETSVMRAGEMAQTIRVPEAGTYRLSFAHAARPGYASTRFILDACIDGESVIHLPALTLKETEYQSVSNTVELTAGEHVLSFVADDSSGVQSSATIMIDDVQLRCVRKPSDLTAGEIRLASGATLELDYDGKVEAANVLVDGVKVNGGKAALRRAGVTVTGRGSFHTGEDLGLVLIVR